MVLGVLSVWNEAGAFLDFAIDPAYYQTTWFRLSRVASFLALLAAGRLINRQGAPQVAVYGGNGSTREAANFVFKTP